MTLAPGRRQLVAHLAEESVAVKITGMDEQGRLYRAQPTGSPAPTERGWRCFDRPVRRVMARDERDGGGIRRVGATGAAEGALSCWWGGWRSRRSLLALALLLCGWLVACASPSGPVELASPPAGGEATPRASPTRAPEMLPPIVVTPAAGATPGDGAFFRLTVIVEDETGQPLAGLATLSWPDSAAVFTFGPATRMEIPLRLMAAAPRFLVTVEKEGYFPVRQPFEVTLREDLSFEWVARLRQTGWIAAGQAGEGGETPWSPPSPPSPERVKAENGANPSGALFFWWGRGAEGDVDRAGDRGDFASGGHLADHPVD